MDYEDLFLAAAVYLPNNQVRRRVVPKVQNYKQVIETYTPSDFRSHFRLTKHQFEMLLQSLTPEYERNYSNFDPLDYKLLIFLWTVSNLESYRGIADRFGVAKSGMSKTVKIISQLLKNIAPNYIKWPTGNYLRNTIGGFNQRGFPNTIGAIDGCHIPIQMPPNIPNVEVYFNRKKFSSVIVLAVCDDKTKFTYINTGTPGSFHDSRALRRSELGEILQENDPFHGSHIIGDSAFPLSQGLMVPYRDNGHLTRQQQNYNTRLSSSRMCIERAFGLLKGKFRRLRLLHIQSLENATNIIVACTVLHNFSLQHDDQDDVDNDGNNDYEVVPEENLNQNEYEGRREQRMRGRARPEALKREFICAQIA